MPIKVTKLDFNKPVAVIFNPTSGSKRDIRPLIQDKLTKHGIKVNFFETLRLMHAWDLAKTEIDVSQHCALLACGGDGTIHEVINGLLTRPDK